MLCCYLNLNNWPLVFLLRPEQVVDDAEDDEGARHQDSKVHAFGIGVHGRWPEAEKQNNNHIEACKSVVDNATHAGDMPWAPG